MNGGSARFRSFGRANSWGSRIWLRQKARAEGEEPLAGEKNIRPQPVVCNPAVCNERSATENATQTQMQNRRMIWLHKSPEPGFKGTKWFHRTNGLRPGKSCSRKKRSSPN